MPSSGAAALLRRVAQETKSLPRSFVEGATKTVKKAIDRKLVSDTGGDRSLSNAPGRLRITTKVDGTSVVTGTVSPGPKRGLARWTWLEDGTKPHAIGRGEHPGTRGKGTWTKPAEPAVRALVQDIRKRFSKVI